MSREARGDIHRRRAGRASPSRPARGSSWAARSRARWSASIRAGMARRAEGSADLMSARLRRIVASTGLRAESRTGRGGSSTPLGASRAGAPAMVRARPRADATAWAVGCRRAGFFARILRKTGRRTSGMREALSTFEGNGLVHVLQRRGHGSGGAVGGMASEELVEDAAQAVDVAPLVRLRPAGVLRAQVLGGAEELAHGGDGDDPPGAPALGHVQVHESRHPVVIHHDVLRLDVLVQKARLVHGLKAGGDLPRHVEGLVEGQARRVPGAPA